MRLKGNKSVVSEDPKELDNGANSMLPVDSVPVKVILNSKPGTVPPKASPLSKPLNFSAMEGFSTKPSSLKPLSKDQPIESAKSEPISLTRPAVTGTKPAIESLPSAENNIIDPAIDDETTEEAIDDIVISESNELLAAEDAAIDAETKASSKSPKKRFRFLKIFKNKWLYFCLGLLIIAIFALPFSRYKILGLFLKNQYQFTVVDSVTDTPVSGASVDIKGKLLTTNANGQASINLPLGKYSYKIEKHYYSNTTGSIFIGLSKPETKPIDIKATGRQVPIEIVDKISGKPISDANISVQGTNFKTNSAGKVSMVLSTKGQAYLASVSASGYNSVTSTVVVTLNSTANIIDLVPSGSVYFLTQKGTIDVIKANLDGSDPQVVLAGTGSESPSTTYLMASPDLKYLVLEAQRSGTQPELYIINTSNSQLTEFDSSPDAFTLVGWSGDQFIYDETDSSAPTSNADREQLKSYNATTQQLNVLDQDQVNGDTTNYDYQSFYNFELLPDLIIYNTQWNVSGTYDLSSSSDTIRGVEPNGLNKKDYYSFPAANTGSIAAARYQPDGVYFSTFDVSSNQTTYYAYTNGAVTTDNSLTAANFSQTYPTYYLSPSGSQTLWSQTTSGQIAVFEGDRNGQSQKQISLPNGYSAYGWYDNVYILLSKDGQLYISPVTGTTKPVLIGSYFASAS
jgi:hypothetical protein